MKGLYFYKLVSPYREDMTKDCKLTINEIDSNFINLKDADIKSCDFDKETKRIRLTKNNGNILETDLSSLVADLTVDYDKKLGVITIKYGDETVEIDGLITDENALKRVSTDSTLLGIGTVRMPLGIKPTEKTGQVVACEEFINVVKGGKIPGCDNLTVGTRFLIKDKVSKYGFLYDFKSVNVIGNDLHNGWRIPTKADWDDMLNSIEICDADRTHASLVCNKELGKIAGKFLKSTEEWKRDIFYTDDDKFHCHSCEEDSYNVKQDCGCAEGFDFDEEFKEKTNDYRDDDFDSEYSRKHVKPSNHVHKKPLLPYGVDAFGMTVLPVGYGDGCKIRHEYYGERCGFWTSTMVDNTDIYVKRFSFNKAGVGQTAENPYATFSLRLVKDYDGINFNDVEFINGQPYPCVLMPAKQSKTGFAIWTAANLAFEDAKYHPQTTDAACKCKTFVEEYLTIEWNGRGWFKKVMHDGDSIVLKNGVGEDSTYTEYRLINGELVSVTSKLYEEIFREFDEIVTDINEKLDDEINRSMSADTEFSIALSAETTERIAEDEAIREALSAETADRILEDEAIRVELSAETETRITEDGAIREALSAETTERIAEDEAIREALSADTEARINADNFISGAVDTLREDLTTETETRIAEDEAIREALSAETEARIAEDQKLFERLVKTEGSSYDSVNGVLTLETENSDNNITIQFNGNYGTL